MRNVFLKVVVVLVFITIIISMTKKKGRSRGMRNNNPFNMNDTSTVWEGEIIDKTDSRFSQFITLDLGIRAGLISLYNMFLSKGLNIFQIINGYAPKSDNNDVEGYVKKVSERTGIDRNVRILKEDFLKVAEAILFVENGFQVKTVEELKAFVRANYIYQYIV